MKSCRRVSTGLLVTPADKIMARFGPRTISSTPAAPSPTAQLREFIAKFDSVHQKLIRAVRKELRRRFPGAYELVYDNYNFFVIGYSASEKPSDAIISLTANSSGVGLCFIRGARLQDPDKILLGSGNQTRFIRLPAVDILKARSVVRLLKAAEAQSRIPFPNTGSGRVIVRSISAKQRPRRKPAS